MTARSNVYDEYKKALLDGGAPPDKVESVIADMKAEDAKIATGTCPSCGLKLTRTLDPRQAGPTAVAGKWFKYRCTGCRWFADKCEPVGEN